ncbi:MULTISPECIES: hypothetical protein [unclassified Algibacter]|uniref:hypothetical protein n=1 Tax=unclassified Algibacter TaxID=2615009 RepID=UPI00131BDAC6|nr:MULTISPECIES: hypothetical protein [unclassified Algibacter]MCL5127383.1 hypothetical protein [Algibacter sp. L4_22]
MEGAQTGDLSVFRLSVLLAGWLALIAAASFLKSLNIDFILILAKPLLKLETLKFGRDWLCKKI